ncbi:MAG: hypothetical protein RDV41_02995, partial [Planctomycetota bacterium]|nr:hypothetical protein [Planctomycetota bacterium]
GYPVRRGGASTTTAGNAFSCSGAVTIAGGGALNLAGSVNWPGALTAAANSTVSYRSTTQAQSVKGGAGVSYCHMEFANTGQNATLAAAATVTGTLVVQSGGKITLAPGASLTCDQTAPDNISLSGTMTMNGSSFLYMKTGLAVNAGGAFESFESGGNKPTVEWHSSTRYSFEVNANGRIHVGALTF